MDRIVIVSKPSRLEELVLQHLTEGAARFIVESRGQSMVSYTAEDAAYKAALAEVRRQLPNDVPVATVSREDLPNFLFRDNDLIVVCGPDGLFANLAKYVADQPILTVNPDPKTVSGALMLFPPSAVGAQIALVRDGKHRVESLPFVKASIDDDRVVWGINDIFVGRKDHISARYEIEWDSSTEHQSSSGVIVSTGIGCTGWMKSVATMVSALTPGGAFSKLEMLPDATSEELVFVVREPYPSPNTGATIVTGRITPEDPLVLHSEMPDGGYIFSDGVVEKAVEWRAGSTVVISVGDRYVQRIVR